MSKKRNFILIKNIKIQNANAQSSPYTIGLPAMTAWMGAVHALQRKLNLMDELKEIIFTKIAVSNHEFMLHTRRGKYISSIIGTANPLEKDGSRSSFIEEARCSLTVSLLIEFEHKNDIDYGVLCEKINQNLPNLKMASGDILSFDRLVFDPNDSKYIFINQENSKIKKSLMLGYVLIDRRDLLKNKPENQDFLDYFLSFLTVQARAEKTEDNQITWTKKRKEKGWIVPIAAGFQGISKLQKIANQRDSETDHCFAESILTLGEFKMPTRINEIDEMLWSYQFDEANQLYLCVGNQENNQNDCE